MNMRVTLALTQRDGMLGPLQHQADMLPILALAAAKARVAMARTHFAAKSDQFDLGRRAGFLAQHHVADLRAARAELALAEAAALAALMGDDPDTPSPEDRT